MKTPREKKDKPPMLIYGRPKRVDLPEPTLERQPEATDTNQYSVMFGPRRVDARVSPTQLLVSLRDVYNNSHKSLRNQITWQQLCEASECEDPMGKGWVDLQTAVSILKRCSCYKMWSALFKLDYRGLAKEILLEEERQGVKVEAEEEVEEEAGEGEQDDDNEDRSEEIEESEEYINPQRARARRFNKSQNELVEDAEDVMGNLEAEHTANLAYHLWWSTVMRQEFREKHGPRTTPRMLQPANGWGSWPRPYSVIGLEPTKYVDVDDPTGGGGIGGAPAAFMLDPPEVYPRFDFTVPLFSSRTMQSAASLISAEKPDIDMVKAYQVEERASFAPDEDLERMDRLQEVEEEEEEEEEEVEEEQQELASTASAASTTEPLSTLAQTELDYFDEDEYGQIMDLIDPNPDDFNAEVFKEGVEEPPPLDGHAQARKRRKEYEQAAALPEEKTQEYFLEGLKSLQTGLNSSYQREVYDRIHRRKREDGAAIEPATLTSPQMPQQCMAEVKSMLDDMLRTAVQSVSTSRSSAAYKYDHRILDWAGIEGKYGGVGRTRERMVTLLGEPKVQDGRPSAAELQAATLRRERRLVEDKKMSQRRVSERKRREGARKKRGEEGEGGETDDSDVEEEEDIIPVKEEEDLDKEETQHQPISAQLQYAIELARGRKAD